MVHDTPRPDDDRHDLRRRLLAERERFVAEGGGAAQDRLEGHLRKVLEQLEPVTLGLYWPIRLEFNAAGSLASFARSHGARVVLPYCTRGRHEHGPGDGTPGMHYRAWDGQPPTVRDACGVPSCDGEVALPDVVLVPCLGYTAQGFRLGYGAGFFDRWLAAHPGVTSVGVAWSCGRLEEGAFAPRPHDQPLTLVVTDDGVV
jgi:5,10-methenyltetrahydrofolate synthetase